MATWRSLFDGGATEGTLRRILKAVTWARTSTDQIRTVVDSGTITTLAQVQWGNTAAEPAWYGNGAPMSIDMRELLMANARSNYQQRTARWTWV